MRMGSRSTEAIHIMLKMVIYKGLAIHQSSVESLDDLLNSK